MKKTMNKTMEKTDKKDFRQRVYDFLTTVPPGRVVTYGEIAFFAGSPRACRAVGNILHSNPLPDVYPCFRVVNREGRLADHFGFGGAEEQKRRLEEDGIKVKKCEDGGYYVDLERYLFVPEE